MNILLFGKGGQVGWELQRSLAVLGHVTALDHDSTDHCGDFANPESIAHGITDLLKNPKAQQKLVAAGHKRLKDFSWDKVADDIYQRIAQAVAK